MLAQLRADDDLTETSDLFKIAMRQMPGAFHRNEKARLVGKLKAARDRKRPTAGKNKIEARVSGVSTPKRKNPLG
jgi:hypothetical protein